MNHEQEQQLISLRSELEQAEKGFTRWLEESQRPRFSRRFASLNEQTARHKAARYGERILELKADIAKLEGEQSEAA
jgi:hypothetical protein